MKKLLLLKSLLLLCALVVGTNAWAGTVTRTENFSSSEASTNQYDCNSAISTASNQTDWDYAWTPSGSGTVFKNGIKLGKSGGTGSVANTTMLSGISTGTSITIKVYAARWNTDTGNLTVTYNGSSESKAPANSAITTTTNTYSALDFSSSTNFTITKAASVTSFTIASSAKRILIDKVEVVYEDGPAKSANDLAWSVASKSVTYSETPYNLPTLSNPHSLVVTYESSNESVATVASDGTVTVKNVTGSTTISAHTDGDATYAAGTVSYTLNVTQKVILEDGVFNFGFGEDYGSGMSEGTTIDENEETWTSGNITMYVAGRNCWYNDGTFRLYKESGGVDAGSVTLNCPSDKAITRIEFTGPYTSTGALSNITPNKGTYTVTSSSAIWTGAAQSVTFTTGSNSTYINTITVTYGSTISITPAKEYTTLTSALNLDFTSVSSDLKAYIATEVSGSAVQMVQVNKVPAGTGLVLKATTPGTAVNVPVFDGTSPDDVSGNKMAGSATSTTAIAENGGYILSNGFFQPATAGTLAAGKAYLNIAVSAGARSLEMNFDDETTGVDDVRNKMSDGRSEYFNLAGQRVAQPTKGLYIVNGKKYVIK